MWDWGDESDCERCGVDGCDDVVGCDDGCDDCPFVGFAGWICLVAVISTSSYAKPWPMRVAMVGMGKMEVVGVGELVVMSGVGWG